LIFRPSPYAMRAIFVASVTFPSYSGSARMKFLGSF